MKWYKRKFWYVSPKWLLLDAEMRQVNIQIDWDGIHIQWIWTDGVTYDELAFFDEDEARDMAQLVAGTYIKDLEHDLDFYNDMVARTKEAIAYAKMPPEDKKNAILPLSEQMVTSWLCQPVDYDPIQWVNDLWVVTYSESIDPIEWTDLAWHTKKPLSNNPKTKWTKQKRQSKKKAQ